MLYPPSKISGPVDPPKYHMLYPPSKISGPVDKIEHEQPFKFAYTDNPRKINKPVE